MRRVTLLFGYAVPVAILVFILCRLTVNVPYWDDYGAILGWFAIPWPDRLEHLLDFHNEHRLLTARIIFECIYRLLGRFDFQVCMAVGGTFLLAYSLLIGVMMCPLSKWFHMAFLPCFWLLISFIQYENLCWAMTAASNFQVHFWALLALLASWRLKREITCLVVSVPAATLATFSVGGGMAIWPCLIMSSIIRKRWISSVVHTVFGLLTVVIYMMGFPHGMGEGHFSFVHATLFFISFAGSWVPWFPGALSVGAITLSLLVWFAIRFRHLRDLPPLIFAGYLLANMFAAALFRSGNPHAAMSFRYILLPISLLACTVILVMENIRISDLMMKWLCRAFMSGAVLYSLTFLVLGGPQFAQRNEIMRRNLLCWPRTIEGLRTPNQEKDGKLLEKCCAMGIYDPQGVCKKGEPPLDKPLPWLR